MNGKYLIPICLFIVCQTVYDFFAPVQSTNWSIFYFSSQYISWLILLYIIPKPHKKTKKIPYFVLGIGLLIYIGLEVSKIGESYSNYYYAIGSFKASLLPVSMLITGLTYFIFRK